ncbi:MAG: hypothetical protein B7Y81_04215 [Caulobacter sp. 32-67-35]|nr:MAG: hypothetical protein B7Y81_04215 [Caulobacter sp. 32-67-35]
MAKGEAARVVRLTKRSVDAVAKEAARFTVWDSDLKGFGLRVEPSGSKTFIVRYRVGGGRRGTLRQAKVGRYGKLTPDQAREEAERILAKVELGQDPQADKAAARETLTMAELCDLYLAEGISAKKASTIALDKVRIARHIKPAIGARKITDLHASDIQRLTQDIAAGKLKDPTPHSRGGPGAAARTAGLLGGVFKFAVARKLCAENPAAGVKRPKDRKRDRFLSPKELGALGDALTTASERGANPGLVTIIRLLCLTGARKNEIARLRWSEVNIERGRLELADSKTGEKVVPLGAAAMELLSEVARTNSAYVFPDPRDASIPIRNLDWFWVGIRRAAALEDVRIHDLRHSFASVAVAGGSSLFLIGKLLGHADAATTQRYAHLADDPLQAAADRISQSISSSMAGTSAEVRTLRGDGDVKPTRRVGA